jgi:hypothetical protein
MEVSASRSAPPQFHAGRALTAWLNDDEAVHSFLGRTPMDSDDLAPILSRVEKTRDELARRPEFEPRSPILELGDRSELDAAQERPDIQTSFSELGNWRVEIVDMRLVLAVQKTIKVENLTERVAPVVADPSTLLDFCLPTERKEEKIPVYADLDKRGFSISSIDPNLRIVGTNVAEAGITTKSGPIEAQAVVFLVNFGSSFLNIARSGDRYFLRDGYHRVIGLLRAGISRIPAVVFDLDAKQPIIPGSDTISKEICFGDRPPLLSDFFDPTVSDEVRLPAIRKIIRIRGEEFFVTD